MDTQVWTYLIVGITFPLYLGIAIWAKAGSTKEFYIAGGGVHPVANGMATAANWMSAASFLFMAGLISTMGFAGTPSGIKKFKLKPNKYSLNQE